MGKACDARRQRIVEFSQGERKRFQTTVRLYDELQKKKKKVRGIRRLKKEDYVSLFRVRFLTIESDEEAQSYLDDLTLYELVRLEEDIKLLEDSYAYVTLFAYVADGKYLIDHADRPKCQFGVDPNMNHFTCVRNKKINS